MPFNIQNFISHINQTGTLKNNSFEVRIAMPEMLRAGIQGIVGRQTEDMIRLRAEKVTLPGINMDMTETKRYGVGPVSKAPTNVNYTNINIEFLETQNQQIYKLFYEWVTTTFDFTGAGGGRNPPVPRYNTEYARYYSTDMTIDVYRQDSQRVSRIRVIDAFPISISDKSLSWSDNNSTNKVDVAFQFKEWLIDNYETVPTPRTTVRDVVPITLPTFR